MLSLKTIIKSPQKREASHLKIAWHSKKEKKKNENNKRKTKDEKT